jgi:hypothetical protein
MLSVTWVDVLGRLVVVTRARGPERCKDPVSSEAKNDFDAISDLRHLI